MFSFHWGVIGQPNTDSLEFRLEFEKDPIVKVELLEKISRQLKYQNIDKSLDYAQQALQLATDIEDDKAIINLSLTGCTTNFLFLWDLFPKFRIGVNFVYKAAELRNLCRNKYCPKD